MDDVRSLYNIKQEDKKYQGKDFESLGINKGMDYDKVIETLATMLSNKEESKTYSKNTFGMGEGVSPSASLLTGRYAFYEISNKTFKVDLTNSFKELPYGFSVKRVGILMTSGTKVLFNSNRNYKVVPINEIKLPSVLELDVLISSPTGDIKLTKKLYFNSLTKGKQHFEFKVNDYNTLDNNITQEDFLERVAAEVNNLRNQIGSINHYEKAIKDSVQSSEAIKDKYESLEKEIEDVRAGQDIVESVKNIITENSQPNQQVLAVCDLDGNTMFIQATKVESGYEFKSLTGGKLEQGVDFEICKVDNTATPQEGIDGIIMCNGDDCYRMGITSSGETTWTLVSNQ